MSMANPPDGWAALTGAWGTDIDHGASTVYIGSSSIEFKATAVAAKLKSDYLELPLGTPIEVSGVVKRVTGAGPESVNFQVVAKYYDAALSLVLTTGAQTHTFTNNDAWEAFRFVVDTSGMDNTVKFVVLEIGKTAATADLVVLGAFDIRAAHRAFRAYKNVDQTITAAGGTQVVTWETENFDYGDVFTLVNDRWDPAADNTAAAHARKSTTNGIYRTIWQFNANCMYSDLADTESAWIALFLSGTCTSLGNSIGQSGSEPLALHVSDLLLVKESDTVDVRTDHTSGSNRTLESQFLSNGDANYFSGFEISP